MDATSTPATWTWLGRRRFADTAALQERLRGDVLAGRRGDTLLLLEHDPVITLGRSADRAHVLASAEELAARGITLAEASRGGDVTYHGPGQLVGYPVFRLARGVLHHVSAMADAIVAVLRQEGVEASWRRDVPGVWVGGDKICAFGVNVHRRVAIHGFALNVASDLASFATIVPCGLSASGVTSIARVTGRAPSLEELAPRVAAAFAQAFRLDLRSEPAADVVEPAPAAAKMAGS